ncbi:PAS domain S-box protein [Patescibacteria group bacterium]|nr:PAS domain S-box protein [Patescibacteria group bacterium]MBU1449055.1 PAS domain S-box protein [Patescibacteria group bacterium]
MAEKAGNSKDARDGREAQTPRRGFALPWRSLSFQLSFPVGLIIFIAVALGAYLNIQGQSRQLTERVKAEGAGFAETIRRATFRSMMADQRGHLYSTIRDLADQPGINRVRIFNAEGRIIFSSLPQEQGTEVDKKAEACFGCHAQDQPLAKLPTKNRSRIFKAPDGQRILGTILPVYNQPSCASKSCHAPPGEKKVLGVLDVDMSLASMDAQLDQELHRTLLFALLLFLAASTIVGLSVIFTVSRVVKRMSSEVDKLAAGDHQYAAPLKAPAELGVLAESIAYMAERVARRTERLSRRYRQLVDDSPNAIFLLDDRGCLLMSNPEAGRMLGLEPEKLAGVELSILVAKEDRPFLLRALEQARSQKGTGDLVRLRFPAAAKGGRVLEGRFRAWERENGPGAFIGTFLDKTDRSELESQLMKHASDAAVGQTVAGLVPYIRNLLHGLNNASYIVDQGLEAEDLELLKQGWQMVNHSVRRVASVAEDLLYYADYKIGELRPFDLNHLLQDVKSLSAVKSQEIGAALLVREDRSCQTVIVDQKGLRRALLNLVNNALDALAARPQQDPAGRVVLSCEKNAVGQVIISVDDNGPGIPEEVGRYLFTGLFSTKGAKGTGMGLLLVQKVVEDHGGYVSYSCPLDGGTRFTLVVPEPQT